MKILIKILAFIFIAFTLFFMIGWANNTNIFADYAFLISITLLLLLGVVIFMLFVIAKLYSEIEKIQNELYEVNRRLNKLNETEKE